MRYILPFVLFISACATSPGSWDTGTDFTDGDGASSGSRSTWAEIQTGYCSFRTSSNGGQTWSEETVNVPSPADAELLYGGSGDLIELYCDASVVPQYDLPRATIDPYGCPMVYCNPWGGTSKHGGEAAGCGDDLWVYVYPEADTKDDCGPWDLN